MNFSMEFLLELCLLFTVFRTNSATITNNKYREVTKTIEQNHAGSVLTTSSWNSRLGCASSCDTSQCISFSYNSVTKECKTYGDEICYKDDGVTSSSVRFYVKTVKELLPDLNHCGDVPSVYCSAVYTINPLQISSFDVYCDMDTAGGPWTVVTNRYDGSLDFYKPWSSYRTGFGTLTGEFWIGFAKYRILQLLNLKMRIEMGGWDGSLKYVEYTSLTVSPESSYYTLSVTGFSTPHGLGNMLAYHHNEKFTTYDIDNDDHEDNCAEASSGAWWYDDCYNSNLFGIYINSYWYKAMVWKYFYPGGGEYSSLKSTRMMLATP